MKILVTGGRHYNDFRTIDNTLDRLSADVPVTHMIEGGATGADHWGRMWAEKRGVHVVQVPALWDTYGKSAGHIRNGRMADLLRYDEDMVVAFPGGKGTASMVEIAKRRGIKVLEVNS